MEKISSKLVISFFLIALMVSSHCVVEARGPIVSCGCHTPSDCRDGGCPGCAENGRCVCLNNKCFFVQGPPPADITA
ncbi:hypothetical protein LINPERPRIM_LOCUS27147, partial [Linum perenne]